MSDMFFERLAVCSKKVESYIMQNRFTEAYKPEDLRQAILAYPMRSGKRLRPAVLMWCCGAADGDIESAIPAAAAVELFHTWTLVHDDLIDNDNTRRGGPTVHKLSEDFSRREFGYSDEESIEYGRDIAILAGDLQHSWSILCLTDLISNSKVNPGVALAIINELESRVVNTLIEGETLDVQFAKRPIEKITPDEILRMLWAKTGALYEFAARSGAMIGVGTANKQHPTVSALAGFAGQCGTAFQLQDDILGIVGDEKKLGKPIGSDLREGKKTLVMYYALESLGKDDTGFLLSVLGNRDASIDDVQKATRMIVETGAVEKTAELARSYVSKALKCLDTIPDSEYKSLLNAWADFMVDRAL